VVFLEITKVKKTTYKIFQVAVDFFTFNERYKQIRQKFSDQGFDCFICKRPFKPGEKIGLVVTNKGNKVVCRKCAEKVSKELLENG
jgi:hypothetical protein